MTMTQNQNQWQRRNVCNKSFENASEFKHLRTTVTNTNDIYDEISRRINSRKFVIIWFKNHFLSHPLSKMLKIRVYKTIVLLLVLYRCEMWSATLREKYKLQVSEQSDQENVSKIWETVICWTCDG